MDKEREFYRVYLLSIYYMYRMLVILWGKIFKVWCKFRGGKLGEIKKFV